MAQVQFALSFNQVAQPWLKKFDIYKANSQCLHKISYKCLEKIEFGKSIKNFLQIFSPFSGQKDNMYRYFAFLV